MARQWQGEEGGGKGRYGSLWVTLGSLKAIFSISKHKANTTELHLKVRHTCHQFTNTTKYLLVLVLDLLLAEPVRPGPGLAGGLARAGAPLRPLVTSRTRGGTSETSETSGTSGWTSRLDGAGPFRLAAATNTEESPLLGHAFTTNIEYCGYAQSDAAHIMMTER